jgi:MYXO-CTERM domain-containing protein
MRKEAAILVTTALLGLSHIDEAHACTCAPPPPTLEAVAEASAVFQGSVVDITPPSTPAGEMVARISVERVWKRSRTESVVEVHTPANSAACGLSFKPGSRWLIYADEIEGNLRAVLCSRSKPLDAASDDLAALGPGTSLGGPSPVPPGQRGCACEMAPDRALPWGAPLALAAAAALAMRRRSAVTAQRRGTGSASPRSSA